MNLEDEKKLIYGCLKFDHKFQKKLYEVYAPKLRAVCMRYCRNTEEVKDILQDGFMKIFTKIQHYKGDGSFEGWMKKIMINTALEYYRKNVKHEFKIVQDDLENYDILQDRTEMNLLEDSSVDQIMSIIDEMNNDYKIIFNMYYIDDYTHKEISKLLSIEETTSRMRLHRAKKIIAEKLSTKHNHIV